MADWFAIEYESVSGEMQRVDFKKVGYVDAVPTTIQGTFELTYDEIDDPFETMRPSSAIINVEASTDNEYLDLYSEIEREWLVEIRKGPALDLIWNGWLVPEGIFEDYVNNVWIIQLTAECGLASLKNKAFVDLNGEVYKGKANLRQILSVCLDRTGFSRDMNFQCRSGSVDDYPVQLFMGGTSYDDFFNQTVDMRAFLNGDNSEPISCAEVIRNIISSCNGTIFAYGGMWYIHWVPQVANPVLTAFSWLRYTSPTDPSPVRNTGFTTSIGPERASYYPFWINANQRIERRPSIGATQVSRRFVNLEALNTNPDLDNNGSTISGWTHNATYVTLDGASGLTMGVDPGSGPAILISAPTLNNVRVGQQVNVEIEFNCSQPQKLYSQYGLRLKVTDGVTTYYSYPSGNWTTTVVGMFFDAGRTPVSGTYRFKTGSSLIEGQASIEIFGMVNAANNATSIDFYSIKISANDANNPQGIDFKAERIANPSSFTQKADEVVVGDYESVSYEGTYWEADEVTPTDNGYNRPIAPLAFPQLYIANAIDRLFVRGYPSRVFMGDVYGFFSPLDIVSVAGFSGVRWDVCGWSWDSRMNTISVKLFQLHWAPTAGAPGFENEVLDDTLTDKITNFGSVVEPTIKG